jgi:hypothetical protein
LVDFSLVFPESFTNSHERCRILPEEWPEAGGYWRRLSRLSDSSAGLQIWRNHRARVEDRRWPLDFPSEARIWVGLSRFKT